jgi:hypothetical protein
MARLYSVVVEGEDDVAYSTATIRPSNLTRTRLGYRSKALTKMRSCDAQVSYSAPGTEILVAQEKIEPQVILSRSLQSIYIFAWWHIGQHTM